MQPTPTTKAPFTLPGLERFRGYGPVVALVLLCIAGGLLNPDFATVENLMNVLTRTAFIGIIAVGMTFVIVSGGIDLSVGSMAALIAGAMIMLMNAAAGAQWAGPVATVLLGCALALLMGGVLGGAHGLLVTRGRIEPFIATLGTLGIFRATLTYLSDGGALTLDSTVSDVYSPVYYQSVLGVPIPVLVFLLVAVGGAVILNRTAFGQHVQAIGSNEQVANYAAIRVDKIKVLTYLLLGVCVAIATILYVPRLGSATPTTGILWELEAIAAVVVGGTSLKGGSGRIMGTVIGAILLSVIGNIVNLTSIISVHLNAAVQGVVIITVAYLQRGRR
ncbi:ribose transport system permease protein [Duganella sp. 1411]|jgi:ribose transport system permease protein|uniref:ABC transporter permease n=1 Tax=Duganella sp. 1411 TaxID=2806572 RepID=UPI001AE373AB|nr:ABC transporter permease [Duganella sp. 1411]MBP1202916.1 ribose transport system permease protein [Duganella sp. 1411]